MTWIQTYTGRQFYPLAPRAEDVDLRDIAHHLAMKCRFTGACRKFYSVAEHSVRVVWCLTDGGHDTAVLRRGLLHDAAEAYLPDLARPLKRAGVMFGAQVEPWPCDAPTDPFRSMWWRGYEIVEQGILEQVGTAFSVQLVGDDDGRAAAVRLADNVLLATEARDLMADPPAPWEALPDPLPTPIKPWSPGEAEQCFLEVAKALGIHQAHTDEGPPPAWAKAGAS